MSIEKDQFISIIDDTDLQEDAGLVREANTFSWHILIVDDEQLVHDATELALKHEKIFGRSIVLHHAYSAQEGLDKIRADVEYVAALIDVVMEKKDSGLTLVQAIREEGHHELRIVLRTGQPGYAPELSVLSTYDINDYRTKTELTKTKLLSVLVTAIRSYQQLRAINRARKGLELIVDASSNLFQQQNVERFGNGVLTQITALLGKQTSGMVCIADNRNRRTPELQDYSVICGTGTFQDYLSRPLSNVPHSEMRQQFAEALTRDIVTRESGSIAMHVSSYQGDRAFIYIDCDFELSNDSIALLRIFGMNIFAIFNNINLIKKLDEMAYTDALIGIPNINAVRRELQSIIEEQSSEVVLILIHIDELGKVFSFFGSEALDQIFNESLALLSEVVPNAGIIARSAWGDFAVLMNRDDYDKKKIESLSSFSIKINGSEIQLTSTIAVSASLPGDQKPENIIQRANLTLVLGKSEHRGQLLEYDNTIATELKERISIQYHLRESFKTEVSPIEVYLQPKFDTLQNKFVGAEALSRWKMGDTFVSPVVFIPILEKSGLSMMLIDILLRAVAQWHTKRRTSNQSLFPISVNLSMRDIPKGDYAEYLLNLVSKYNLSPDIVEFEVTEGVMMRNAKQTIEELCKLKSAGYRIAVDDFGTGYSSLSYLDSLPIDILKIDRAFVSPLTPTNARRSIAATIIAMAESLDLEVVAEGIETEDQSRALQFLGCNICQGYLFGKPVSIEKFDLSPVKP